MTTEKQADPPVLPGIEPLEPASVRTSPTRQRMRRRTGSGDRQLDDRIRKLVAGVDVADRDLLEDIIETSFRMARTANRGELKLVSRSFRELGRSFRIFAPYRERRKVSIFGSARTDENNPEYATTRDFAAQMAARGWMVITGAGPGIMAAGHEGAGAASSFGVGIKLPMEQSANGFIAGDPKLIDFKYFFTRKITFMKESDAFALLPGGFGTMDEAFELLTLMQTGKTAIRPGGLLEQPGSSFWWTWVRFIGDHLVNGGLLSPEDMSFFELAHSIQDAMSAIDRFYANYHSARYVGERLIIRLRRKPPPDDVARLNREFRDIVGRGSIQSVPASPQEVRDDDVRDLPRIAFHPAHNFGRIRQLIDALNALP